jgi:hypothetical protein
MRPMSSRAWTLQIGGSAAIAVLTVIALLAGAPERADAAKRCGTYNSTSSYERARVVAIRGVKCKRAVRIARSYDRRFVTPGSWVCGLAHGGGRRLFSCGAGGKSGDLRDWPHALKALGVGPRT